MSHGCLDVDASHLVVFMHINTASVTRHTLQTTRVYNRYFLNSIADISDKKLLLVHRMCIHEDKQVQ